MIAWEARGAGKPIVLVHGITEDRHLWDRVVPLLANDHRCVLLDLRGHGESPLAEDQSALAMAEDVGEVVRAAGIDEPPILVGHSLGGFVVTAYATQAPTRGVINVDQPLRVGDFARQLQPAADLLRGPEWRDVVREVFSSLGIEQLSESDRQYVIGHVETARPEIILGAWGLLLDSSPDELDALVESLLPTIDSPYLALHGSQPAEGYREWLSCALPGATFEVWDGLGHFIPFVDPQRLADRVRGFASP